MNTAIPCISCGALPIATPDHDGVYLQCSNMIDCPVWPATPNFPSEPEAIPAWNAMNTLKPLPAPLDS